MPPRRPAVQPDLHIRGPFEGKRRPPVAGLAVSAAVHVALILLAVGLAHRAAPVLEQLQQDQSTIALAPMLLEPPPTQTPVVPAPEPPPPAPGPAVADEVEESLPEVDDPGLAPERTLDPEPSPVDPGPEEASPLPELRSATPTLLPSPIAHAPSMEDEARRIFGGPRRRGAGTEEGTEDGRPLLPPLSNGDCPFTIPPDTPGEPVRMTSATGRVLREGTNVPLEGALLQVIGTSYSTMSGQGGVYLLTIPLSLVANCRVQYVRIVASGYRSRLLPLTLGATPASDDVELRRR